MRSHLMGRIVVTPNVVNPQANGINYIIIIIKVPINYAEMCLWEKQMTLRTRDRTINVQINALKHA